jgi:hypothetical protein
MSAPRIILKMEDEPAIALSFERFDRENDLSTEEREDILGALDRHGYYEGGGGAQPDYTLHIDRRSAVDRIGAVTWGDLRDAAERPTLDAALKHIMDIAGIETGDVAGQMFKAGWPSWKSLRLQWLLQWLDAEQKAAESWPDDVADHYSVPAPKTHGVWCEVSGGFTGHRENWMRDRDGRPMTFTKEEAEEEAKRLRETIGRNSMARFSYRPVAL